VKDARTPWFVAILAVAMLLPRFGILSLIQSGVDASRSGLLTPSDVDSRTRLIELGTTTALGSFRAIAVIMLWDRAQMLKERREWVEYNGVVQLIAKIQPTDIEAYNFQVWNLAYNVQHDAPNVEEGWKWVERAIELAKNGIQRNPHHPSVWKLYWQLGWTYSHRCGNAVGARTSYFARRVRETHDGRSPYLVAADWYQKAFEAAIRPNARKVNMHHVAMWAYAMEHAATEAEEAGDLKAMLEHRQRAIDLHRKVTSHFPDYERHAKTRIEDMTRLMALHRGRAQAQQLIADGELRQGADLLWEQAKLWGRMISGNPGMEETQRNIDRNADEQEALLERIADPEFKQELYGRVAQTRYWAADPRRRSREAVDHLVKAVQRIDHLSPRPSNAELLRNRDLVMSIAEMWIRIVIGSPADAERAQQAATAVTRADQLLQVLPENERGQMIPRVTEHWATLLEHSTLDAPLGRRRVAQAAKVFQAPVLALAEQVRTGFQGVIDLAKEGAPAPQQTLAFQEAAKHLPELNHAVEQAVRFWRVLLRKDKPYIEEAPVAEANLRQIAERFDQCHEAFAELSGEETSRFSAVAEDIWRMLYQHDPTNEKYHERGRHQRRREVPSAHVHGPGCGH